MDILDKANIANDDDELRLTITYSDGESTYDLAIGEVTVNGRSYVAYDAKPANGECIVKILAPKNAPRRDVMGALTERLGEYEVMRDALFAQYTYGENGDGLEADYALFEFPDGEKRVIIFTVRDGNAIVNYELAGSQDVTERMLSDFLVNALCASLTGKPAETAAAEIRRKYDCDTFRFDPEV